MYCKLYLIWANDNWQTHKIYITMTMHWGTILSKNHYGSINLLYSFRFNSEICQSVKLNFKRLNQYQIPLVTFHFPHDQGTPNIQVLQVAQVKLVSKEINKPLIYRPVNYTTVPYPICNINASLIAKLALLAYLININTGTRKPLNQVRDQYMVLNVVKWHWILNLVKLQVWGTGMTPEI